jgi:membrane protein
MPVSKLEAIWIFLRGLARNYKEDGCQSTAAALTYQTLFAVVPLLTITYTVLAGFQALSGAGDLVQKFLFENIVPETVSVVQSYLQEFSEQAKDLSVPSLLVVVFTAFLMMFTIEKSFNEIWRINEPRHGLQRILMYWALLTLGPVLVGGGLAVTTYIISLPLVSGVAGTPLILGLVPVIMSTVGFTLMYVTIPNCVVPLRHGLIGGFAVAILFEAVKQLFGTVMSKTDFEVIYGTFAAVPLFLIWLYVSWTIVLFGAELTKGLGLYRSQSSRQLEAPLLQILIILEAFFQCHKKGGVITDRSIMALGHRVDMQSWHDYKSKLLALGIIRAVDRGGLVLSKDLNELTFWDLYQSMSFTLPAGFSEQQEAWEGPLHRKLSDMFEDRKSSLQLELEGLFRGEIL